jgi:hypothetical protein
MYFRIHMNFIEPSSLTDTHPAWTVLLSSELRRVNEDDAAAGVTLDDRDKADDGLFVNCWPEPEPGGSGAGPGFINAFCGNADAVVLNDIF